MAKKHPDEIRIFVRDKYAEVANRDSTSCRCTPSLSCGGEPIVSLTVFIILIIFLLGSVFLKYSGNGLIASTEQNAKGR
jgi:hypothetical protein